MRQDCGKDTKSIVQSGTKKETWGKQQTDGEDGRPIARSGSLDGRRTARSSRSSSGERRRPRVRSNSAATRTTRRQLKGEKKEVSDDKKNYDHHEDHDDDDEEEGTTFAGLHDAVTKDPRTQDEKQEMLMMDFSTMSFDNDWDVRPKSMRPSLDTAKALEAVMSGGGPVVVEQPNKQKLRRKLKS